MFSKVPWFIKEEIVKYLISYDHKFSLMNQYWFSYYAKELMFLEFHRVKKNQKIFKWFKLAGKLCIDDFSDVNWDFLLGCNKIKSAYFGSSFIRDFEPLCDFINRSELKSISLSFDKKTVEVCDRLLKGVCHQLVSLVLTNCNDNNFDILLKLNFPNILYFEVYNANPNDLIDFAKIHRNMPKIESIFLIVYNFSFNFIYPRNLIFIYLKSLHINIPEKRNFKDSNVLSTIYQFHFPSLISLSFSSPFKNIDMEKISRIMPRLKSLYLQIDAHDERNRPFPVYSLPNLEDLKLYSVKYLIERASISINLNNLPKLWKLEVGNDFNFSDSSENSSIKILIIKRALSSSYHNIFNRFSMLKKINLDCIDLKEKCDHLFELFNKTIILTLTCVSDELFSGYLPLGPFKTTHLTLEGYCFLTNNLLSWLARQKQLTNLTLKYSSGELEVINFIHFPYLQVLNIYCKDAWKNNFLGHFITFQGEIQFREI